MDTLMMQKENVLQIFNYQILKNLLKTGLLTDFWQKKWSLVTLLKVGIALISNIHCRVYSPCRQYCLLMSF